MATVSDVHEGINALMSLNNVAGSDTTAATTLSTQLDSVVSSIKTGAKAILASLSETQIANLEIAPVVKLLGDDYKTSIVNLLKT